MQIQFGETVRRLRRERGLTQEQLAGRLNVAFQTISNWERGECTPDLGMLPAIAGFFGVSADELLGVNQVENERRIQEILGYFDDNFRDMERWEEYKAALQEALRHNPNDYRLWELHFGLLTSRCPQDTAESLRARLPEVMSVYENIMENCTNVGIRADVCGTMCHFYGGIIRHDPEGCAAERAAQERIVSELPDLYDTRQFVSTLHLSRSDEEMKKVCQESVTDLLEIFDGMALHLTNRIDDEREDIAVRRTMLDVFDAVYPDGDYGKSFGCVVMLWEFVAVKHAQEFGEYDEAFAALRRAAELSLAFDAQPRVRTHTSPLFRGYVFEKSSGRRAAENMRRLLNEENGAYPAKPPWWPEDFKADPRFAELLALLNSSGA